MTEPATTSDTFRRLALIASVVAVATFIQSFTALKLAPLALFALIAVGQGALRPRLALWLFYGALSALAIVWALLSLFHPGNFAEGITDALRLYVQWSIAFLCVFTLIRAKPSLVTLHHGLAVAGVVIAGINILAVLDLLYGLGLIPESIRSPMELYVGLKDGYLQITSNNIGALFVIVPYLLAFHLRRDTTPTWWTRFALIASLAVALLSGRRALWLAVALLPPVLVAMAAWGGQWRMLRARPLLIAYTVALVVGASSMAAIPAGVETGNPIVDHTRDAFGSEDERTRQAPFLLARFDESPWLGSGFGAYAGYSRSEDRPWNYELTYHKLLMNLGLIGTLLLLTVILGTVASVLSRLRAFPDQSGVPFALLVAFCALCIGAYSNPYFGSFDYLFFVGFLPYLASFRAGWVSEA